MRRLTRRLAAVSAAALLAPVVPVRGQSVSDIVAYAALVFTPTAGVAPVARQWMLADPRGGVGVDLLWGHLSAGSGHIDDVLGGVALPFAQGRGDVAVAAGYVAPSCDGGDCSGNFVGSVTVEGRVFEQRSEASMFALGLSGQLGYGKPSGGTILSGSIGLPLSLAVGRAGHAQVVPFVTPAFGWGRVSGGGDSESGTRMILGGGIGMMNLSPGLGLTAGVRKVFISGGKTVFGLGLTWSAPTPAR